MLKLRSLPLLLAGLLAALCLCSPGLAAPKEADPNAPAFVDLSRVLAEYRKTAAFQKYGVRLRDQGRALNEEMRTLAKVRYCTEPERKEALAISAKPAATPEEKARLEALTKKSDAIENEHALLSQKQNPTAAEAKRLADIAQMRRDAAQMMAKEEADRREQLQKLDQTMLSEVQSELLKLVERVAKDEKISYVYNRTAVLYGGNDLTDAVIKKLPK